MIATIKKWTIMDIDGPISHKRKCAPCNFFHSIKVTAKYTLKGNEFAEHAKDTLLPLCERHFEQLRDAGEV